jgi:hypothetical protein
MTPNKMVNTKEAGSSDLRSSRILLTVEWQVLADVSVQHICPIFKGQVVQDDSSHSSDLIFS